MKNKVTVTRATRLKAVPFKEIPDGTLCLNSSGITINDKPEVGISLKAGGGLIRVSESYHLDYKIPSDGYVTFDSFDDMCKWVANGRKLEDLPSDDGQCLFSDLEFGELFLIFNGCGAIGMKTDDCKFVEVGACGWATEHPSNSTAIVTRLNIGDTIEITE